MHDSRIVANYMLDLAEKNKSELTPMQLLKLVYIAHGWTLGLLGRYLINDPVEAWQYGPVIPKIYEEIRKYRGHPVLEKLSSDDSDTLDEEEKSLVEQVYDIYGKMSGPALSRLTHKKGSPWHKTYEPNSFGRDISSDLIQDHYARLAATSGEATK